MFCHRLWHTVAATILGIAAPSVQAQALSPHDAAAEFSRRSAGASEVSDFARSLHATGSWRPKYNPKDGLTLGEAEQVVLFYNPSLRATRVRASVPAIAAPYAGLPEDPELDIDLVKALIAMPNPWVLASSISFTIPLSGKLEALKAQANAQAYTAFVEAYVTEQETLLQFRDTWIDWTAATHSARAVREMLARLDNIVSSTAVLELAQELTRTDARPFEISYERRKVELIKCEGEVKRHRRKLVALMGLSDQAKLDLTPGFQVPDVHTVRTTSETLASYSPRVVVEAARYQAAMQGYDVELRKQTPDIRVGPAFEEEEGTERAGGVFGMTLPLWNRNRQAVAETGAQLQAAAAEWEAAYLNAISEAAQAKQRRQAAQEQIRHLEDVVAPLTDTQVEEALHLDAIGAFSPLLLLEALNSALEVRLEAVEAQAELARARVQMLSVLPPQGKGPAKGVAKR